MAFFILMTFSSCSIKKDEAHGHLGIIDPSSEIKVVKAKLILKKAYNKIGKEMPYEGDFYLVYDGQERFVKMMESDVTKADLDPLLNKTCKFEIIEEDGLWDTDNPEVQSRVGPYVRILKIINN